MYAHDRKHNIDYQPVCTLTYAHDVWCTYLVGLGKLLLINLLSCTHLLIILLYPHLRMHQQLVLLLVYHQNNLHNSSDQNCIMGYKVMQ